jgi:hypothetical protein
MTRPGKDPDACRSTSGLIYALVLVFHHRDTENTERKRRNNRSDTERQSNREKKKRERD